MSREIKFRLYSKLAKKYIDYLTIGFSKTGELRNYSTENGVGPVLDDDYIVEQYTGLKDRHGTEIYEGDVVLDYYDGEDAFIVKWDEDTASFILTGTDNIAAVSFDNFDADIDLEVLGNIHENPELLEGEDDDEEDDDYMPTNAEINDLTDIGYRG